MTVNIIDVADELDLTRAGKQGGEHRFFDPHDTNTPDLWVNEEKNQWYTFSNGLNKGGGYIDLVEHVKDCSRESALEWMGQNFPEQFGGDSAETAQKRGRVYEVLEKAVSMAEHTLRVKKDDLYEEFKEERGFSDEAMDDARIGFLSQTDVDTLLSRFRTEDLVASGLFNKSDNGDVYPVMKDRILFPYLNDGKPVFAAGRALSDDADAKYKKTRTTDFNRHILYQFRDGRNELIVTEGFTDALSGYIAGYDVVCPATTRFKDEDIRRIQRVAEEYGTVYIVNDADEAGRDGARETARVMAESGIDPLLVELPDGQDLDDFTAENGYELEQALTETTSFIDELVTNLKRADPGAETEDAKDELFGVVAEWRQSTRKDVFDQLDTPNTILEYELSQFVKEQAESNEYEYYEYTVERQGQSNGRKFSQKKLAEDLMKDYDFYFIKDSEHFMVYEDGRWIGQAQQVVNRETQKRLGHEANRNRAKETAWALQSMNQVERPDFQTVTDKVNVANGVFDLETGNLVPHSPAYKFQFKVPWEYDPSAECPKIEEFLDQVTNGDEDKKRKLVQAAAHTLIPDIIDEKAHVFVGRGNNGKTFFIELIKALHGKTGRSYASKGLSDLDNSRFEMTSLYGKTAMFDDDLNAGDLSPKAASQFKKLVGGTDQRAELKNANSFYSFQPYATPVFAANELPPTPDSTNGFFRRWHIVHLPVDFVEDPSPNDPLQKQTTPKEELMERLTTDEEMEGFLAWCIEELQELYETNNFHGERSVDEKREMWKKYSTPVRSFIHRFVEQGVTQTEHSNMEDTDHRTLNQHDFDYVRKDCFRDLMQAYVDMVSGENLTDKQISHAINDSALMIGSGQVARENRQRCWTGMRLVLPEEGGSDVPPFVYRFLKDKYADSRQSVRYVSDAEDDVLDVEGEVLRVVPANGKMSYDSVIEQVVDETPYGEEQVEDAIEGMVSGGDLYEPRPDQLSKL